MGLNLTMPKPDPKRGTVTHNRRKRSYELHSALAKCLGAPFPFHPDQWGRG